VKNENYELTNYAFVKAIEDIIDAVQPSLDLGRDYWICGQYAFETEDLAKRFLLDPKPPIIHVREVL
jgi:hypothetical protein